MLRQGRRYLKAMLDGRYERLLAGDAEVKRWERFALRVANTPGSSRVVLELAHQQEDGLRWRSWLVYKVSPEILATDRLKLSMDEIHTSEPSEDEPAIPEQLADAPIFHLGLDGRELP